MTRILFVIGMLTVLSCDSERTFNAKLSDELQKLRDIDQTVAVGYVSRDTASELNDMSLARWTAYHDSILSAYAVKLRRCARQQCAPAHFPLGFCGLNKGQWREFHAHAGSRTEYDETFQLATCAEPAPGTHISG